MPNFSIYILYIFNVFIYQQTGCLHILTTVNNAARNLGMQVSPHQLISFPFDIYPEVESQPFWAETLVQRNPFCYRLRKISRHLEHPLAWSSRLSHPTPPAQRSWCKGALSVPHPHRFTAFGALPTWISSLTHTTLPCRDPGCRETLSFMPRQITRHLEHLLVAFISLSLPTPPGIQTTCLPGAAA